MRQRRSSGGSDENISNKYHIATQCVHCTVCCVVVYINFQSCFFIYISIVDTQSSYFPVQSIAP